MINNRKKYSTPSHDEKLRYMQALESEDMNISLTARELGISRQTLTRYYNQLWPEYLENKQATFENSLDVESVKLNKREELNKISLRLTNSLNLTLDQTEHRLKDTDVAKKIPTKDLVQFINVLLPYVAEKRAIIGAKKVTDDTESDKDKFVQNFIQTMTSYSNKQK